MTAYAKAKDVEAGFRSLDEDEQKRAEALLDEAKIIIDQVSNSASDDVKKLVSCRMVRRAIGDGDVSAAPIGATQGTTTAMGYSQSWTLSNGSSGELYVSRLEKQMLGVGVRIGMAQAIGGSDD